MNCPVSPCHWRDRACRRSGVSLAGCEFIIPHTPAVRK
nr:MAG TPA: hypothetical protein [Caudoviricetes sp.]